MPKPARREMTVRVVSLHAPQAGEAAVGGTVEERLAVLARLSETGWELAGRPLPNYTRDTMPVVVTTLKAQTGHA
jgi:hypothetical protein